MKNARSSGATMTFTAGANHSSGDGHLVGRQFGTLSADVLNGAEGVLVTDGVFEHACKSTDVIAQGDALWWDGTELTKTAAGNDYAGIAWTAAGNGVVLVEIKIGSDKVTA